MHTYSVTLSRKIVVGNLCTINALVYNKSILIKISILSALVFWRGLGKPTGWKLSCVVSSSERLKISLDIAHRGICAVPSFASDTLPWVQTHCRQVISISNM